MCQAGFRKVRPAYEHTHRDQNRLVCSITFQMGTVTASLEKSTF